MRLLSIGLGLLGLVAIAMTGWWQTQSLTQRSNAMHDAFAQPADRLLQTTEPSTSSNTDELDAADRIATLSTEVARLRAEVAQLRTANAAGLDVHSTHKPKEADIGSDTEDLSAERAQTSARFARIDDRLRGEMTDTRWAPSATAEIERAVLQTGGSTLQEIQCGSTLCRAVIDHGPNVNIAEFELSFLERVGPTLPRSAMKHNGAGSRVTQSIVYLARDGHRLVPTANGAAEG